MRLLRMSRFRFISTRFGLKINCWQTDATQVSQSRRDALQPLENRSKVNAQLYVEILTQVFRTPAETGCRTQSDWHSRTQKSPNGRNQQAEVSITLRFI